VRGRADGYDPDQNLIEEVKTYRGQFTSIPTTTATCTGPSCASTATCCASSWTAEVNLALVYFDIGSQQEPPARDPRRAELKAIFEDQCGRFIAWAEQELRHRERAQRGARRMRFPHADSARPAPARRSRVPRQRRQALPAGPGPDRHRQDRRHHVPGAEGGAEGKHRQAVLPGREDAGPQARPGRRRDLEGRRQPAHCACWN
jgi:hypothetical protein